MSQLNASDVEIENKDITQPKKPICGIVMPISSIDGCSESHWADVLQILKDAVADAGFEANLVSNSEDIGVIQKRIIQNLYENEIVVCDVSGKNANVMFELGIRLTFDKPAIVIKDDKTGYSFDTSPIEHLEYPRDLRFGSIVAFKEKLARKLTATLKASREDPKYTTFLKHFGTYKISQLESKEVSGYQFILTELDDIKRQIGNLQRLGAGKTIRDSSSEFERAKTIANFAARLRGQIDNYCKRNKVKFVDLAEHREKLMHDSITTMDAASIFESSSEFMAVFDIVFDSLVH